ncbi:hypothetical protein TIFTF001_029127 [Ficus carica]|uniref:Uncharacterized protein n=1 Tax=Ficus carica TaxID=3494 RepID=A0AA88IXK7_FICCA|nr:hypothetical protein TIFTF001_029127 [Ficus carica]
MTPPSIISHVSPSLPRLQSMPPSLHSLSPLTLYLSPLISTGRDSLSRLQSTPRLLPPISSSKPILRLLPRYHAARSHAHGIGKSLSLLLSLAPHIL